MSAHSPVRIGGDLAGYYDLHARWYDLTRPFFLFGRRGLLRALARHWQAEAPAVAPRVLEIGCGTGSNLAHVGRLLPGAERVGIDLAPAMLERARRRLGDAVTLLPHRLGQQGALPPALAAGFDLVVMSYMLSMTGPAREDCIAAAVDLLRPGGLLGVVDFWSTPLPAFARWMDRNHVQFAPRPEVALASRLEPVEVCAKRAFGGVWRYGRWIGRRVAAVVNPADGSGR